MPTTHATVDENGTVTLNGAPPGLYAVTVHPNGNILMQPAQILTHAEVAELARGNRTVITETEREARRALVRSLVQQNPHVRYPEVDAALRAQGYDVKRRTVYYDMKRAYDDIRRTS